MLISWKEIAGSCDIKGVIHCGAHNAEEAKYYDALWIEANTNLAMKLLKKGYRVINAAVSDKRGNATFYECNKTASSSLLKPNLNKERGVKVVREYEVPTIILDDVINDENFINMDIQGGELKALKGLKKKRKQIDYLYLEVHERETYKGVPRIWDIDKELIEYERVITKLTHWGWGDALYIRK